MIWCSAHTPSAEQLEELSSVWGVKELLYLKDTHPSMQEFLNNCGNDTSELVKHAKSLHEIARTEEACLVQVGGSSAFQYIFGKLGMTSFYVTYCLYAHSERVSEDIPQEDGSVKKISVFKHICFTLV